MIARCHKCNRPFTLTGMRAICNPCMVDTGRARIRHEVRREICKLYDGGMTRRAICKQLGVSEFTINETIRVPRSTWM